MMPQARAREPQTESHLDGSDTDATGQAFVVMVKSSVQAFVPARELLAELRAAMEGPLSGVAVASDAVADELAATLAVGHRLALIGLRLRLPSEALLTALEHVASRTPAGSESPAKALTEAEEAVLREAGSLRYKMPALEDRASFRTQLLYEQLVESALTVKEAAVRLGVSEGRVRQRLSARSLVGIERGGVWRLPIFQFTEDADVPGIGEVLSAFPADAHPASILRFMESPSVELDADGEPMTPKSWLVTGGSAARVAELVRDAYFLP